MNEMIEDKKLDEIIETVLENVDIEIETYTDCDIDAYPYIDDKTKEKVKVWIREILEDSSDDLTQKLKDFAKRVDRDDKDWSIK